MRDKLKGIVILGGALVALGAGGAAIAAATGGDGEGPADDAGEAAEQVSDQATADRARDAALEATGGGTVTEIERADEGDNGYEVEVKRPDGSFAEVALDAEFNEVSVESDDD